MADNFEENQRDENDIPYVEPEIVRQGEPIRGEEQGYTQSHVNQNTQYTQNTNTHYGNNSNQNGNTNYNGNPNYNSNQNYNGNQHGNNGYSNRPRNNGTNGYCVASLVLGIIGLFTACCVPFIGIIPPILALVFGILGLKSEGKGMAIAGIVLGGVAFIPFALSIIFMFTPSYWYY